MKRSHTLITLTLLIACSLAFAQIPPADPVPRKPGGFMANSGANCRGATAADDHGFTTNQDGMQNTGGIALTLVCNQPADEFARATGNGTPNVAGLASFTIVFRNNGAVAQAVTCTGYAGRAGGPQYSGSKTVTVQPGGRQSLFWNYTSDNAGVPFQRPTNLVCTVPPDFQANENSNRFFREVGDF